MLSLIAQKVDLNPITPGILPFSAQNAGQGAENLVSTIIGFLTIVSGLAFIVYFIIAGFGWITAGTDMEKVKKAQSNITNAIVGLIIVVIAYAVTSILGSLLNFPILSPATLLERLSPGGNSSTTQNEVNALELFFSED